MAACIAQQPYEDVDSSNSIEDDDSIFEEEEEVSEPGKTLKRADTLFYDAGNSKLLHSPIFLQARPAWQYLCKPA